MLIKENILVILCVDFIEKHVRQEMKEHTTQCKEAYTIVYYNIMNLIDKKKLTYIFNIFFPSFLQALCGSRVEVPLLGGERMMVNLQDEIVKPSTVKRIVSKGLPLPKDPGRRGDLIISFDIVFPERLSSTTREMFRSHLPGK